MASDASDSTAQETVNVDAAHREASQYWGYLIKDDKCGTELFDRLLQGIAEVIVSDDRLREVRSSYRAQMLILVDIEHNI
jgi:hypothetical protein